MSCIVLSGLQYTFNREKDLLYCFFYTTNQSCNNIWGEVYDLQCSRGPEKPVLLEPRPMLKGKDCEHLLAFKLCPCTCCGTQQRMEKVNFELRFWDSESTISKEPIQVIPMSCILQPSLGFPSMLGLSSEIKQVT